MGSRQPLAFLKVTKWMATDVQQALGLIDGAILRGN